MEAHMSTRMQRIVSTAAGAAYVVAAAAVIGLVFIALFFSIGQPWGTLNDLALLVMSVALAPLMLAFYELGGRTPTRLAQAAQTAGWLAVLTWSVVQVMLVIGVVSFDYKVGATGAFAIESYADIAIGLWIAGANLLAGPWLNRARWLGIVSGLGFVLLGVGLLLGGQEHPLTWVGGIGYEIVLPVWAYLMARLFRRLAAG